MFNRKQLIKIIKARKRKNYKYLYENSLKLNMLCFSKLEKLKQFDLVSTILLNFFINSINVMLYNPPYRMLLNHNQIYTLPLLYINHKNE